MTHTTEGGVTDADMTATRVEPVRGRAESSLLACGIAFAAAQVAALAYFTVEVASRWPQLGALAATTLASGTAAALVWPVGIVAGALAMDIGRQGGDPVTMQVLEGIAPLTLALAAMPRAVMLGAAAGVVLASRCAPRWLGWSGVVLAVVNLAGTATLLAPEAFPLLGLGKLLFLLWIAALAGPLLLRPPSREGVYA